MLSVLRLLGLSLPKKKALRTDSMNARFARDHAVCAPLKSSRLWSLRSQKRLLIVGASPQTPKKCLRFASRPLHGAFFYRAIALQGAIRFGVCPEPLSHLRGAHAWGKASGQGFNRCHYQPMLCACLLILSR